MTSDSNRYAPLRPFPAYAFLPGVDPHPTRDPRGHSYSEEPEAAADYFECEAWRESDDYLYGVDLYNHGYLWEAHEAWEGLWHAAKHDELQAEFLQGLIQCAAGVLKVRMQQPRGVQRLIELGTGRLERVANEADPHYMGLDVHDLLQAFRAFAEQDQPDVEVRPIIELDA
jgi:uncharacterized protein